MYRRALLLKRRILSFPVHQCSILTQYTFQRFSELVCGLFLREMRRYLLLINPHAYSIPSPANSKCYLGVDIIFTPLFSEMNSMMDVSKIFTILQKVASNLFLQFYLQSLPNRLSSSGICRVKLPPFHDVHIFLRPCIPQETS